MRQGAAFKLTNRQRSVMERIDRRVPIKVIAQEMGVSETRINQHIRALKDVYGASSLNSLVEIYRSTQSTNPRSVADFGVADLDGKIVASADPDYRKLPAMAGAPNRFYAYKTASDNEPIASLDGPAFLWMPPQHDIGFEPARGAAVIKARLAVIAAVFLALLGLLFMANSAGVTLLEATSGHVAYVAMLDKIV